MPDLTARDSDGYITRYNQSSWSDARDNATGTSVSDNQNNHTSAASAYRQAARGGGYTFSIFRSFFHFNTNEISTKPHTASIRLFGYSQSGGTPILLKSTGAIATLGTGDFNAITGYSSGHYNRTDGIGGGSAVSAVTPYSQIILTWTTIAYNIIPLNDAAITDMVENDDLYVAFVNYTHDLQDIAPTGYIAHKNGCYYEDATGITVTDPILRYDEPTTAVFFGANF